MLRTRSGNATGLISTKRIRPVAAAVVLGVVLGACGSSTVDLESLGLAVAVDVQAGGEFELVVPSRSDTTIEVVSTPPGVSSSVTEIADGESIRLVLAADPDTPRGSYNVALLVTKDGTEHQLGWPFDVVDPATDTTQP
ncbi:MAG: hypothetical protein HKN74_00200 [Acidimicrobiia bacterium]|nr:hypothetical protein [Acidimicrobiia bacterium]NNL70219.1 hypothetical protein [Acidimicrobiia bacterium]